MEYALILAPAALLVAFGVYWIWMMRRRKK